MGRKVLIVEGPFVVRLSPQQIRALREAFNVSQARFGKMVGVGKLSVLRWESGVQVPHASHVEKMVAIAKRNGVSL